MKLAQIIGHAAFLTAAAAFCLSVIGLAGCGKESADASKTVYFVSHTKATDYTGQLLAGIEKNLNSQGVEIKFLDANRDASKQIDLMDEAIAEHPAAIVLLPVNPYELVRSVEKANEAEIPVIVASRDLSDGKFALVKSDEKQAGQLQGEFMAKNLPPNAKIVYLMGEPGQSSTDLRWEGFKEACLDKRGDIELLAKETAAWNEAEGLKNMTLWLQTFPQIDGVIGANDTMTLGAMKALQAANRNTGVLLSGIDAKKEAVEAVAAGNMTQTIKQDAQKAAEAVSGLLQKVLSGQTPTDEIKIPFTEVTRANVSQFK